MALSGAKFNASLRIAGNVFSEESRYQQAVLDRQVDATLDPGATPTTGDRYTIENSAALHANFGTISGVGDDDIVEYDGSNFVVVWDASAQGSGACTYDKSSSSEICFNGSEWSTADHPAGGNGITFNDGANRFDLDLGNTDPGLELTASDGSGELRLSTQGNGIAGGAGSLLSVDPATEVAGSRASIYLGADGVGIDVDNSTLTHTSSTLQIKDGGVGSTQLADDSVTAAKLNADTAGLGLTQAVGGELDINVDDSTVEISIDTLQVKDAGITSAKLASDSVITAKILDANVTTAKIADDAITNAKIATDAVNSDSIAADAVTSSEIAADAVGSSELDYAGTKLRSGALTDPFTASLTRTFTHNWSTTDVMVEVFDSVTGETCFVDSITRTANAVAITLNQTPTNSLRILLRELDGSQTTITVA